MYASFLGISEALHMDIFHQPLKSWFFDILNRRYHLEEAQVKGETRLKFRFGDEIKVFTLPNIAQKRLANRGN